MLRFELLTTVDPGKKDMTVGGGDSLGTSLCRFGAVYSAPNRAVYRDYDTTATERAAYRILEAGKW